MSEPSKRLKEARELVDKEKTYTPEEAIELAKKTSTTKFTGSIEVHINLAIDPKLSDQSVRGQVSLPHSTGKTVKVAAFVTPGKEDEVKKAGADIAGGEELIKKIRTTQKTDFDVAVAEPSLMPKLAQIAKILGPRGLMPNPKSGTITEDVSGMVKELKAGRIDFRNDDSGNVHTILGKADIPTESLVENLKAFIEAVERARPSAIKKVFIKTITVNSTMGPGVKVEM